MSSPLDIRLPPLTEHQLQSQCVRWFALQYPNLNQLLFAIPNGGHRSKAAAGKAKAEGAKRGVADLFLSVPKHPFAIQILCTEKGQHIHPCSGAGGLYIEMKTLRGRQSPDQARFQQKVEAFGYQYTICRSLFDFQQTINTYLNTPQA